VANLPISLTLLGDPNWSEFPLFLLSSFPLFLSAKRVRTSFVLPLPPSSLSLNVGDLFERKSHSGFSATSKFLSPPFFCLSPMKRNEIRLSAGFAPLPGTEFFSVAPARGWRSGGGPVHLPFSDPEPPSIFLKSLVFFFWISAWTRYPGLPLKAVRTRYSQKEDVTGVGSPPFPLFLLPSPTRWRCRAHVFRSLPSRIFFFPPPL